MILETYIDLINGLNNQVDNLKRALLYEFHNRSVWVTIYPRDDVQAYLDCQGGDNYTLDLDNGPVVTCLADIKQLRVHDHRLVIVL